MAVTGQDLTRAVKTLHASANCEADWRAVCSRAYYSIYQDGLAFHGSLKSPGALSAESTRGLHNDLFDRLKNPTLKRDDPLYTVSKQVGYLMASLHLARVKADYKRDQNVSAQNAATSSVEVDAVLSFMTSGAPLAMPLLALPKLPAQTLTPAPNPSAESCKPATSNRPTLTVIK
jgi:hypothetical protein